ncbi:MAG: cation diffusion facilitator family transporter [Bryobacteraceae bacterium]
MTADRAGRIVAIASMLISAALATAKIIVGLNANSTAVVSDGLESVGDVLTSGLVLFGLFIAAKPPDSEHPYGHGRLETLSALVVGMILIASGSLIAFRSIQRAWESQHTPAAYAVWPLIASIGVKSAMSLTKWRLGRKIRSAALTADAWHDTVDIFSGTVALIAVGITLFDPLRFAAADHLGGSAVGLIVIFVGARVVRDTTLQLMDTMPDLEDMQRIREVGLSVPGALGIEKCYARKTGLQWHVDLHLDVDPAMSVFSSHEIASEVRARIREKLDWVADVLVHVEPHMLDTISSSKHGKS